MFTDLTLDELTKLHAKLVQARRDNIRLARHGHVEETVDTRYAIAGEMFELTQEAYRTAQDVIAAHYSGPMR